MLIGIEINIKEEGVMKKPDKEEFDFNDVFESAKFAQQMIHYVDYLENRESIMWVKYDTNNKNSKPKEYGKYLVCRKDKSLHWETFNGTGWAYNENSITYLSHIKNPMESDDESKHMKLREDMKKNIDEYFDSISPEELYKKSIENGSEEE